MSRLPHGAPVALRDIVKRYAGVVAVDNISLDIASGEFVSFLGPSGSGKTTTLMMIAGFALPSAGTILLGDADITDLPPHRRNIGMVYQNYALFPHMSVGRNIAFPLRMRGMARAEIARRIGRALSLVQLQGMEDRLPAQLSGGQQQRVALARALVFEPPLLLMDEPLGALDKKLREELQVEIKRIQREIRSTVIYVTHDQEEALSLSDRIVVMNRGRIEQAGPPSEIYERPRTRFVAEFLGSSNFLEASVEAAGAPARLRSAGGAAITVAQLDAPAGKRLTVAIRPERIRIAAEAVGRPGALAASVLDVTYHGDTQRYSVRLEGGDRLIVFRPNMGQPPLMPGKRTEIAWNPADAWVLPED
jgi:spermidine/putrescine ABC transporter ATP-binding subunit